MIPSSDGKLSSFVGCNESLWIKVNVEQSGFYRVLYGNELSARLRKAVEKNCLSAADKLGILDDMLSLSKACKQSLSSFLWLMNAHKKELDSMVLSKLINACYDVVEITTDAIPDSVNALKEFCINLLKSSAERLGWEPKSGESHLDVLLHGEVLKALAIFGHVRTQKEAVERFQILLNDKSTSLLPADMKLAAYFAVMRNASTKNRNHFESLLKLYREADAVQEKERILQTIASSTDRQLVLEVLNFMVSNEVRDSDVIYVLGGLSLESCKAAWKWLQENWNKIMKKYSGFLLHSFVRDIITLFSSNEKADEAEAFFESNLHPGVDKILKQSIEKVQNKARWIESIKQEQSLPRLLNQLLHMG